MQARLVTQHWKYSIKQPRQAHTIIENLILPISVDVNNVLMYVADAQSAESSLNLMFSLLSYLKALN